MMRGTEEAGQGPPDGGTSTGKIHEFSIAPGPLAGVGPLVETGVDGILAPPGFKLRAVARHLFNPVDGQFDPLGLRGYAWHKAPDGGGCFAAPDGGWVYVSNSESNSAGGVGALRFDCSGKLMDAYRVLDGTRRNCAGGVTPWHTWLSCEEVGDGQVFECDPFGDGTVAHALPMLGRFDHEAAAVDLLTGSVFMTEDAGDGRFYRFLADPRDRTPDGQRLRLTQGRLQVLEVAGLENGGYAYSDAEARALQPVRWVDAVEPDLPQWGVREALARQGRPVPGTCFRNAEGLWLYQVPSSLRWVPSGGRVPSRAFAFFACKADNRIYALDVDNGLIETVFDNALIELAVNDVDNLVVGPAGDVIVTEDGASTRLIVVVPNRPARTLLEARHQDSELTGPAFSPDGSRLYFSSQRGPNLGWLSKGTGVTYELTIPQQYRRS